MSEQDKTPELARIEDIIDSRGLEEAVDFVFASSADLFSTRLSCLEEACGITLGPDHSKWETWLRDLREGGATGFGAVADGPLERVPPDARVLTNLMSQASDLALEAEPMGGATVDPSVETSLTARGRAAASSHRDGGDAAPDASRPRKPPSRRQVGNYEIIQKLGEGGMGMVYKARQLSMDRVVALKILASWLARDKSYVARFLREAKLAARLDHPNIVRGIDAGSEGRLYYFAMEYVEGEPLSRTLKREKRYVRDVY